MQRSVAISVIAGIVGALLYTAVAAGALGGMILAYLAPLPLLFAGLSTGLAGVGIAGAVTTAILVPLAGSLFAIVYAATTWAPAAFITRQSLLSRPVADGRPEWYPPGLLLGWLTAAAGLAIIAAVGVLAGSTGDAAAAVRGFLVEMFETVGERQGAPDGEGERFAAAFAAIFPAMVACSWLLMFIVNGALAQGLLIGLGWNLRPSPRLAELELPAWLLWALIAVATIGIALDGTLGYTATNLSLVFALPFFILGLGVVHYGLARFGIGGMGRVLFYLVLALMWWLGIVVMLLGMAEQVLRVRQRLGAPAGNAKEDE